VVTDLYLKVQSTKIKHQRLKVSEQILISKMNYWLQKGPEIDFLQYSHTQDKNDQEYK